MTMKDPVIAGARKHNLSQTDLQIHKDEINVLIIYTGGTFGMMKTEDGYVPKKNWLLSRLHWSKLFFDREFSEKQGGKEVSYTPETWNKHRLRWHLHEYEQLIDSSELNSRHFTVIAETVEENYEKYDSFIIIYGTDTMAYMASQLSFMFENLSKTVVITGAQIPISEWRNDSESNLIGAFTVAEYRIPEVSLFFNGSLFRGNRSCKESSTTLRAFGSPNYPELAKFDVFLNYRKDLILKAPSAFDKFNVFKLLERRIAIIYVHPLTTQSIFLSAFKKAKAIILQTYGMGNFPLSRVDLVEVIEDALLKYNKSVVIVSQCRTGFVRSSYASCCYFKKMGAILAEDMTIEAVIAKLSYVLGKGYKGADVKKMMMTNLRGEISVDGDITGESLWDTGKILSLIGKSKDSEATPEDLNKVASLLQPVVIHSAAREWNINRLKELIEEGVDINAVDRNGFTALHIAVNNNDTKLVDFLINLKNVNLNLADSNGNSPLYYACLNGNETIAGMLFFKDALLETDLGKFADVLWNKAKIDDLTSIKLFHKAGANLESKNYDGRTVAHIAAADGHENILTFLARNTNFNFDLKDRHEFTPLTEIKDSVLQQTIRQLVLSRSNNTSNQSISAPVSIDKEDAEVQEPATLAQDVSAEVPE